MSDLDVRLARCFQAVFPDLAPADIAQASVATVPAWDSIAFINLLNVVSQEFGFEIDWDSDELQSLQSFQAVRRMVSGKTSQS